jgi:NAD(P)-dependent dehydrogenase (short-subunit alcohol dehydrogenase family)
MTRSGSTRPAVGDGPLHEATLDAWSDGNRGQRHLAVLVARAAVLRMRSQAEDGPWGRGSILLMSSQLARHPAAEYFGTHAYGASKGAIESLVRAAAATYAPEHIRVNAIAPSLVATPMSRRAQEDEAIVAYLGQKQPLADGPITAVQVRRSPCTCSPPRPG